MANKTVSTVQATGLTLYAYPDYVTLASWSTYRVALTEVAQSVGVLAASVFTLLKSQVHQWAAIDVATIMSKFTIQVE